MSIPTYIVIIDLYFIRRTISPPQTHNISGSLVQNGKDVVKTKANTAMSGVEKLHLIRYIITCQN